MERLVGRKEEQTILHECAGSKQSELVSVYGRYGVGKTFLVRECFDDVFDFSFTGMYETSRAVQLSRFQSALNERGVKPEEKIRDWFQAFDELKMYLLSLNRDKVTVFLDELPWMDTPKGNFLSAFSYFWNMWPSGRCLLKLYVCGSATTWMINKFVGDKGGLYGRVTCSIYLAPFSLGETEEYLKKVKQLEMSRHQILELYMILGGIPYYLNMIRKELPLARNIDNLFFRENVPLRTEYEFLFRSLFRDSKAYRKVVEVLSSRKKGMTRDEIRREANISDGGTLSEILKNLSMCDFIREYRAIGKQQRDSMFQLSDLFTLFYLNFAESGNSQDEYFWSNSAFTGEKNAWAGYSFEQVCFHHIRQIKAKLSIQGVLSNVYSWNSRGFTDSDGTAWRGGQIDMLIDRKDDVISICEIKYCSDEYVITEEYCEKIRKRSGSFRKLTDTRKALQFVFITTYGVRKNRHSGIVHSEVVMDDLFHIQ